MLRIEKRKDSGIWRIRGTHHGRRVDQSAKTRSRSQAEQIREAIERQIFEEEYGLKNVKSYTFAEAVIAWIEAGNDTDSFPYFDVVLTSFGDRKLDDLTQGEIDKAALKAMPTQAPATRKRHFYTPLSVLLNFAAREKMMTPMILDRPKVIKKRPDILTPEQVETFLDADPDMANMWTFFIGTGGRTSEIMRCEWEDVSIGGYRATFWDTKGGRISRSGANKARSVDLCVRTRNAIPERSSGRVWGDWAESKEGRFHGPALRMVRVCRRLGWKEYRPHVFRHTWASWQYAINPDPLTLMIKGGWSDQSMIQTYVHLGTEDLGKEVKKYGWFNDVRMGNKRAIL